MVAACRIQCDGARSRCYLAHAAWCALKACGGLLAKTRSGGYTFYSATLKFWRMSSAPLRRSDKQMSDVAALDFLRQAFCLRIGTVGADGWPYVLPLLFVVLDGDVFVHTTSAEGHFRDNLRGGTKVCLEIDEPGEVFAYGRTACDTSISYRSLIAFGTIRDIEDRNEKTRFCNELMAKYATRVPERPQGVFPRLDQIRVYAISIERISGKQSSLPKRA